MHTAASSPLAQAPRPAPTHTEHRLEEFKFRTAHCVRAVQTHLQLHTTVTRQSRTEPVCVKWCGSKCTEHAIACHLAVLKYAWQHSVAPSTASGTGATRGCTTPDKKVRKCAKLQAGLNQPALGHVPGPSRCALKSLSASLLHQHASFGKNRLRCCMQPSAFSCTFCSTECTNEILEICQAACTGQCSRSDTSHALCTCGDDRRLGGRHPAHERQLKNELGSHLG